MAEDYSDWLYYYRVSTAEQQEEGNSLERYKSQGLDLGIPEANMYFDVASGASESREGFNAACHRLEHDSAVEGLITPYHSRLHRDEAIWVEIKSLLQRKSLGLIDLGKGLQPIDLNSPEGEFGAGLDALLAQRQRREIQRHSILGHRNRRRHKRFATAPFGYRVTPQRTLEPNTDEYRPGLTFWNAAKLIVKWLLDDDLNLSQVCNKQLDEWGDRGLHRDRPGTPRSLKQWMENPALRGYFYNTITEELTEMGHPRLLSDAQYESALRKFSGPKAPRGKPHPLSGLLFCTECGRRIGRKMSHGGRYNYLYCLGAKPNAGNPVVCQADGYHRFEKVEQQLINFLIESAEDVARSAAEIDDDEISPEVAELELQILKLEALNDPDLQEAIDTKKARLVRLKNQGSEQVYDPDVLTKCVQAAGDPRFWAVAGDEEKSAIFRELLSEGFLSPDGILSANLRFS